ncbi:MAG: hypothetical protein WCO20_03480 [Holophagaceae bacterium]
MHVSAHPPVALQTIPTTPSLRAAGSGLLAAFRRLVSSFATLGPRTTLTRDPFSAEQNRD